jgi:hypothetical protein
MERKRWVQSEKSENNKLSPRTLFLGKLIGLYCVLVSLAMFAHRQLTVESVTELVHDAPLLFVVGVFVTAIGLAMVIGHNIWSGGGVAIVVTVIGWLSLLKGSLMLFLSPRGASAFFLSGLHYAELYYVYAAVTLLLGLYLFFGAARRPRSA